MATTADSNPRCDQAITSRDQAIGGRSPVLPEFVGTGSARRSGGSHLQKLARVGQARRWVAIFAGRDPGQGRELPPAEGRPCRRKLLGYRPVVFLGMQSAILTDCVPQEQICKTAGSRYAEWSNKFFQAIADGALPERATTVPRSCRVAR